MNIKILPPDINRGTYGFSVDNGAIRYGLSAIKNVGRPAITSIVKEREANGIYTTMEDFIRRNTSQVNKRMLENLIKAGALDCLEGNRRQKLAVYQQIADNINQSKKNTMAGQMSLFDIVSEEDKKSFEFRMPDIPEFDRDMILSFEKEVLKIYLSGHPLEKDRAMMERIITARTTDFEQDEETGLPRVEDGRQVIVGGMITEKTIKYTKKNQIMCFLTLEDLVGTMEIICFPNKYEQWQSVLQEDQRLFIQGRVAAEDDKASRLILEKVRTFDDVPSDVWIQFADKEDYKKATDLSNDIAMSPGSCGVIIFLRDVRAIKRLPTQMGVEPKKEWIEYMQGKYGSENIKLVQRALKNL